MYLKSVEIVGFKSFADKTRLEFKPGIVGVVGPNGCGKSNVMESVRWCIGEMSWKSLRSPSMVQVIFAGTSRRPALNMAEVTLTFDNANALLPVDYSEVTVTRRIYRSGESEYYLNKTQCRLRDIRELFLDTGIGGEGYAIIDQGNVEFVLSSKPEDRRALFEEAAGVARYKAKREEALRKLERVDQDMARLNDNLVLIQEQIGKLENEAKKARLFEKYKEELALQEAVGFVREIDQLKSELAAMEERLEPIRTEAADAQISIDQGEAELATLNLARAEREAEAAKLNELLAGLRLEAARLEERIKSLQSEKSHLESRIASLSRDIEDDSKRAEALSPTRADLEAKRAETVSQSAAMQSELDSMRERLETADDELAAIQSDVSEAEAEAGRVAQERQDLSAEVARVESAFHHLQGDARAALRDLEKTEVRLAADREGLDALRAQTETSSAAAAEARGKREAAEAARKEAAAQLSSIEAQSVECRTGLADVGGRLETLRAQQQGDPAHAAAQAVLRSGLSGVLGQVRQLLDVEASAVAYAEEALGELLAAVVCEDLSSAEAAVAYLKEQGQGRARFVVLSALPEAGLGAVALPAGAKALLSSVRTDARAERLTRALLADVYLLGSTLHGPHWLSGGSDEAPAPRGWLGEGELVARQTDLTGRLSALEQDRTRVAAELASAEAAVAASSRELSELEAGARDAVLALAQREKSIALHMEETGGIQSQSLGFLADIAVHLEKRNALKGRAEGLAAREVEIQGKLSTLRSSRDKVRADVQGARAQFDGLESQARHLSTQARFYVSQIQQLDEQKQSLEQACARRTAEKDEAAAQIVSVEAEAEASGQRLRELGAQLAEQERASSELFARLAEARAAYEQKEASVSALRKRLEELRQSSHELELELSGLKTRLDVANSRLFEQTGLWFEEAKAKYDGQTTDAEKREWLRSRIQKLGNVNMTAPEEMEQHRQRHDFLNGQLVDLAKAQEDLKQAIGKINANTRENFRHTFELVQGHFRRIYGSLFEGGEADLVLTDPENLLETGVDIVAQPPGKKLQSISQLSGGEKALTALALLFAFFSVKPSPFCMLDEADAALDDANVVRFVRLIRDFADKCQFIVISHNKRTMEAAEMIYGVTMEESGVSQLISVELQKRQPETPKPAVEEQQAPAQS